MPLAVTQCDGAIGTITLNHPERRNALSGELIGDIIDGLKRMREERCRVAILRAAAGCTVWSAGHDISELPNAGRDPLAWGDPLRVVVRAIQEFPAPVIGLIEGGVWGGACEMAMACDMTVATPNATFAITPAKLGIPYNLSGLLTLISTVPLTLAKELLFTAQPISAERALLVGMINHVVPADGIDAFVRAKAEQIAANAPLSIATMKEEIRLLAGAHAMAPNTFERIQGLRRVVYDSEDYEEGLRSFREKRRPQFRGQ